jgi:hypothetical protein
VLGLGLLAGCTGAGPVEVDAPPVAGEQAAACAALVAGLPEEIDPGVERRDVEGSAQAAAYGDPPVVLRCGVAEPERVTEQVTINRVDWSVRDSGGGFTWTTIGREPALEVVIPDAYENFGELIVPLTGPVAQHLPPAS